MLHILCVTRMKKNLTLSIEEDLLQKARVYAAMEKTSVNEMIREFLSQTVEKAGEQDLVTQKLLELSRNTSGQMGDYRPSREDTYSGGARFDRFR